MRVKNKNILTLICTMFICCMLVCIGSSKVSAKDDEGTSAPISQQVSNGSETKEDMDKPPSGTEGENTTKETVGESTSGSEGENTTKETIGEPDSGETKGTKGAEKDSDGDSGKGATKGEPTRSVSWAGSGTSDDPYQINSYEKLCEFAKIVNDTTDERHNRSACASLTSNIDCAGHTDWVPIGNTSSLAFNGAFNGNDFTIKGLSNAGMPGLEYAGLFGCVDSKAKVYRIYLEGIMVSNSDRVCIGGIAGQNNGTISVCCYRGSVIECGDGDGNSNNIGGIVGMNFGTVSECGGAIDVVGNHGNVGGVVGWNNTGGTVTNCYHNGDVSVIGSGGYRCVGGVIGRNNNGSTVSYCYQAGDVSDKTIAGGVIGANYSTNVDYCYYDQVRCRNSSPIKGGTFTSLSTVEGINTLDLFSKKLNDLWVNLDDTVQVYRRNSEGDYVATNTSVGMYPLLNNLREGNKGNKSVAFMIIHNSEDLDNYINGFIALYTCVEFVGVIDLANNINSSSSIDLSNFGTSTKPFSAIFNGRGKTISVPGFNFGHVGASGVVENLTLSSGMVGTGGDTVLGGIAKSNAGLLKNCTNTGAVSNTNGSRTGGITGSNTGVIESCKNKADITGNICVGGVAGDNSGLVSLCYNTGKSTSNATGANVAVLSGGIAGLVEGGRIERCYNTGDVEGTATDGFVFLGGIAGRVNHKADVARGAILNCYNFVSNMKANVLVNKYPHVGGIAGYISGAEGYKCQVCNCYSSMTSCVTEVEASSADVFAGGIIGYLTQNCSVQNCYYDLHRSGGVSKPIDIYGYGENDTPAELTNVEGLTFVAMTGLRAQTYMKGFFTTTDGGSTYTSNVWRARENNYSLDVDNNTWYYPHLKGFEYDADPPTSYTDDNWSPKADAAVSITYSGPDRYTYNDDVQKKTVSSVAIGGFGIQSTNYEVSYQKKQDDIWGAPANFIDAGEYRVVVTGKNLCSGIAYKDFDIDQADNLAVVLEDSTYTYDGTEKSMSSTPYVQMQIEGEFKKIQHGTTTYGYSFTEDGKYKQNLSDLKQTTAGTYTVYVRATNSNFEDSAATTAKLIINQRPVMITAVATSKTYGEADPELTYTSSGLVGSDTITGLLTRVAGENVGTYAIQQGTLSVGDNYTITYTGANLTITQRPLTITGEIIAADKIYDGNANATLTLNNVTIDGICGQDDVEVDTTGTFNNSKVGENKPITLRLTGTDAGNYTIANQPEVTASITPYEIRNYDQLMTFATMVNGGDYGGTTYTAYSGLPANLMNDIVCTYTAGGTTPNATDWVPIGSGSESVYIGTFDGGGHKIIGLSNAGIPNKPFYVGLFGYVSSETINEVIVTGTVQNVGIEDGNIEGRNNVGGVIGYNNGGTVQNCYNTGNISGNGYVGGVIGYNYGTVQNCYNAGSVSGENRVGGVVGYNNYGKVQNCYNAGSVSGEECIGGVVGDNSFSGTLTNCYSVGAVSGSKRVGGVVGYNNYIKVQNCYNAGSVSGKECVGGVVGYNNSDAIVQNCYYDNDVCTNMDPIGGGTIDGENVQDVKGLTTDKMTGSAKDLFTASDKMSGFSNEYWQQRANGELVYCYPHLKGFEYDANPVISNWPPRILNEGVWEISNYDELKAFAQHINEGNATVSAILTDNIDCSDKEDWTPIGNNEDHAYTGVFDGNGYTITGLTYTSDSVDYVGLFGYIGAGGKVQNVGLEGGSIEGRNNVGSVAGCNSGTITNCYNTGSVTGTDNIGGVVGYNKGTVINCYNTGSVIGTGDNVGGVVANNVGGVVTNCYNTGSVTTTGTSIGGVVANNIDGTVTNCYNTGSVTATGDSTDNSIGGMVGYNEGTVINCYNIGSVTSTGGSIGGVVGCSTDGQITTCYNIGAVSGDANVGGVVGFNAVGTVTNCYYDNTVCTSVNPIGGGTIDDEKVQNVKGLTTDKMTGSAKDLFTASDKMSGFSNEYWQQRANGELVYCYPHLKGFEYDANPVISNWPPRILNEGMWEISNYDELKAFAQHINEGNTIESAILTGSIDCSGRGDWTPIGNNEDHAYTGVFDGNGYTITGLTYTSDSADYVGLFGYIGAEGKVQNVGLEGGSIEGKNNVGSVAGYNSGTITNCYNTGNISGDGRLYVGGVIGQNDGTVTNCYNIGNVSGNENYYVGGVVGRNNGTITNCYNTENISGNNNYYVGGVVGYNAVNTVTNCYNTGSVIGTGDNVGGVVANNVGGVVTNCYNTGSVTTTGTSIGGVVANNIDGTVTNCYNTGSVTATGDSTDNSIGGMVGYNEGTVINCYNIGSVTSTGGSIGGVVGYNDHIVTNCYYDNTVCTSVNPIGGGTIDGDKVQNVKGLTTADMTGLGAIGPDHMNFTYTVPDVSPWLVREDGMYNKYYPHLEGFNLKDGVQQEAAEIMPENWPPKVSDIDTATQCEVTISSPTGAMLTVYRLADADDEATDDNVYAEVTNEQKVPKGTLLTIRAQAKPGYKVDKIQYQMESKTYDLEGATLTCTGDVVITAVVPSQTYELTLVSDPTGFEVNLTSAPAERESIAYNTSVTITAEETVNTTYKFIGWYDGNKELTNKTNYTFNMNRNITYTARYVDTSKKTIIFMSKEIKHAEIEATLNEGQYTWTPTSAPVPMYGYKFSSWDKTDDKIRRELSDPSTYIVTVTAMFNPLTPKDVADQDGKFIVTVYDEKKSVDPDIFEFYPQDLWLEVEAYTSEDFVCWTKKTAAMESEVICSYNKKVSIKITSDTTLRARYGSDQGPEDVVSAVITSVSYDAEARSMRFIAEIDTKDKEIIEAGIVADSDSTKLTCENATYVKVYKDAEGETGKVVCIWELNEVQPGTTLHVCGYVKYEGATGTYYGDVYHAVAGMDYDIAEKAVAIIESAKYNPASTEAETNKAIFAAYILLPAGCVIDQAGVVAAGPTFDPATKVLTWDTAEYKKVSKKATGKQGLQYTWIKTAVNNGDKWYVRAYVFYTKEQVQHKVYGEMCTFTCGS